MRYFQKRKPYSLSRILFYPTLAQIYNQITANFEINVKNVDVGIKWVCLAEENNYFKVVYSLK